MVLEEKMQQIEDKNVIPRGSEEFKVRYWAQILILSSLGVENVDGKGK